MSSSISSSEAAPAEWGRWLATFFGALAISAAIVFAIVLGVDPYDSGRFGWLGIVGVDDESPRTANASRARDQQFDSAVFGNSTGQLIKPGELDRLTSLRFVQLTIPGTGPREQLAVLDFFLRNHTRVGALVFDTDESWCTHDPALPLEHPFPFWLYGDSTLDYAEKLFSRRAFSRTFRRVGLALGRRTRSRPDGYWDYEAQGVREFQPRFEPRNDGGPASLGKINASFPFVTQLGEAIKRVPAETAVVLFAPPTFHAMLPGAGSVAAVEEDACHTALKNIVAGRPRSNFINYRVDNALTRDRANFMDFGHYRGPIARRMEQGIAESIKSGEAAKVEF
jgi:hypothetical protein